MRYPNWRSLLLLCILGLSVSCDLLPYPSNLIEVQAFESLDFKSQRLLRVFQNKFKGEINLDKTYAQAQSLNNENVASLTTQLQEIDRIEDDWSEERNAIVKKLASIGSEKAIDVLAEAFINADTRPYTYQSIINYLEENPALVFRIAERASELYRQSVPLWAQVSSKTSPVALFVPALTGEILKSMSPEIQKTLDLGDSVQYLRLNAVAALAYANRDVSSELISILPAPELVAGLIDVIDQGEALWCGDAAYTERSNRIVSFSNRILKQVGPQFIPTLTAAAQSDPDPYSDASSALSHLQEALTDTNLNQSCPGCCGSWEMLYKGVLNILKPKR